MMSFVVAHFLTREAGFIMSYKQSQDELSTCNTILIRSMDERLYLQSSDLTVRSAHTNISIASDVQLWQREMRKLGWAMPAVYVGNIHDHRFDLQWTSQVGQDRTIFHLFKGKRKGFFVDLAANDAVEISNTFTLEQDHAWNGICIEANPKYFNLLYQRRCQVVQAAIGPIDNEIVNFSFHDGLSGVVGESFDNHNSQEPSVRQISTVSMEHVFRDLSVPSVIDYLSLDIEGAEEWVLSTFPWKKYTFLAITAERPKKNLKHILESNGYRYVCDHGSFGDELWLHASFPNYKAAIASLHLNHKEMAPQCRN